MSTSFAYAQVAGALGKDPESRSTPGGVKVVNFSVAVEKGFGEKAHVEWFNVVCFRDTADFAEKYLKKGKGVRVSGELQTRSWDDKQTGQKRYMTEILAYKVDFADTDRQDDRPRPTRQERAIPAPRQQAVQEARPTAAAPANDDPDPFDVEPF